MVSDDEPPLSKPLVQALSVACDVITDEILDDIIEAQSDPSREFFDWSLSTLPPQYARRYASTFAKRFLGAVLNVTMHLHAPRSMPIEFSCVAEELALHIILERASVELEFQDAKSSSHPRNQYGTLQDVICEDVDIELLYDMKFDGVADSAVGEVLRMAPMDFVDWFVAFNPTREAFLPVYVS